MTARHADLNRPGALATQFLPPLAVLWPLLAWNDSLLYLGAALAGVIALVSLAGLARKLLRRRAGDRLLRPTLAIALAVVVWTHAWSERDLARSRINLLSGFLTGQCRQFGQCPKTIEGWAPGPDGFASMLVEDRRPQHRILYRYDGTRFELHLDLWGPFDEVASGGLHERIRPLGAIPWR